MQHTLRDAVDDLLFGVKANGEKAIDLADPLCKGFVDLPLVQQPDIEFETLCLGKAAQHVENIVIKAPISPVARSADMRARIFLPSSEMPPVWLVTGRSG